MRVGFVRKMDSLGQTRQVQVRQGRARQAQGQQHCSNESQPNGKRARQAQAKRNMV